MKNLLFVSRFSGNAHLNFEASIITKYVSHFSPQKIVFIGQKHHVASVLNLVPQADKIVQVTIDSSYNQIVALFSILQSLRYGAFYKIHLAYFPSIALFYRSDIVFIHSYWRENIGYASKCIDLFLLKLFIFFSPQVKLVFLGEWIYYNIISDHYLSAYEKTHFYWIHHPFLVILKKNPNKTENNSSINFGIIGKQSAFYKKVDLSLVQSIKTLIKNLGGKLLSTGEDYIPYEEYCKILQRSDYVIFLYPEDSYFYRCSGVFIESIFHKKPVICLSSSMTNYFFNKYGNIGYLCHSYEEMVFCIKNIISQKFPSKSYLEQVHNLSRMVTLINEDSMINFLNQK